MKLTKIQQQILDALKDGAFISVSSYGAWRATLIRPNGMSSRVIYSTFSAIRPLLVSTRDANGRTQYRLKEGEK